MQITLSDDLTKRLQQRVSQSTEFKSVDAYVEYILDEVLKQTGEEVYTKEQEDEVKQRLSDLGYLD